MAYWLVNQNLLHIVLSSCKKMATPCGMVFGNYAARIHLRNMKRRSRFYHSNEGTEIAGIAKVTKEAYQDPTTTDEAWVVNDLKPYKNKEARNTAQEKADKRLAQMALVRSYLRSARYG